MSWDENTKIPAMFYVSGVSFILAGLILMYNRDSVRSYEVIIMGILFLILGIDASRKPTN